MRIFEYLFMQRAFVVGILLAAVVPCVGMVVVCKRLSMIGDALSHTSLAGVAAGLLLGVNPVAAQQQPVWQRPLALRRSVESFRAIRKCRYPLSCQQESVWRVCCPVL